MSRYPYIDRNPCIVAAGKSFGDPCKTVKDALENISLQDKIEAIQKELGLVEPKDYYADCIKSSPATGAPETDEIKHCLRRPEPTPFQALDEEIKSTIYDSYWNKALGKSRDPTPGLPKGMNPLEVTFGISTKSSEPASLAINPPRTFDDIQNEEREFHDLYVLTHGDYYPGEKIKRCFTPPTKRCIPCQKDESGNRVKKCLTWFNNDPLSNVSRRQAAVRNRTLPPLGKALDKTGVTDLFPVDHVFGKPTAGSYYTVADLLIDCPPSFVRRDLLDYLEYANKLRQSIYHKVQSGELSFEELSYEITNLEKDKKEDEIPRFVNYDCIDLILKKHHIFLDRSKIEPFLVILGLMKEDATVNVSEFMNFLDKNKRFPEMKREHYILPPEYQKCNKCNSYKLEKPKPDLKHLMPPAGLPTVDLCKKLPVYRDSMVNMDHLGAETTARTLISPSLYSQYGLTHRDFFKPRTKAFLDCLFKKINVTLSEEEMDEIYNEGLQLDKSGGVCIETFRDLLDERAYKAYTRI